MVSVAAVTEHPDETEETTLITETVGDMQRTFARTREFSNIEEGREKKRGPSLQSR